MVKPRRSVWSRLGLVVDDDVDVDAELAEGLEDLGDDGAVVA